MDEIKRRDPRKERILRDRLHPKHEELTTFDGRSDGGGESGTANMMVNGVRRKNPHGVGFTSADGIKRIDRSGGMSSSATGIAKKSQSQSLPRRQITEPTRYIVVVSDADSKKLTTLDKDMLGLAHQLATALDDKTVAPNTAIVFLTLFNRDDDMAAFGADRVISLGDNTTYSPDHWLAVLHVLHTQLAPQHWIFADETLIGGDLARKLSASLGERPATRVKAASHGSIECGSGDEKQSVTRVLSRFLLVEEQVSDPISGFVSEASACACPDVENGQAKIVDLGRVAVDPKDIPLPETRFILSGGNGVRNWALFHQCADALGATEGASRVAVDNGHMPRPTQVGASGTYVNAKVYIAVGISGAIQHLQGMTHCDSVIAINTDASCDMVKRADLSIIADSAAVMQALIDATQGELGEIEDAS
ncbi:electron transfer flavoprotein subunit alpha/FixB family protein [Enterovibrio calviensis]|uniref:electron transfer flavoprotein subunit alpha/FixB family protein n=1 Tax=Enterovibrio calviensis TaxID=91359 RepID=UPI0037360D49